MELATSDKVAERTTVPAEWDRQAALWVGWPSHPDLWPGHLEPARKEIARMVHAVAEGQAVKLVAMGREACESAKKLLGSDVKLYDLPFGDIWFRDTGPVFTKCGYALRFRNNGWGGKYIFPHDDTIGDAIAREAGFDIICHDYILEGGALEHNGDGVVLTTRQCILNSNRNGWDRHQAQEVLMRDFSAKRIVWLDEGLQNDHTDGHIDNLARFAGTNTVVCQTAFGADDPNRQLFDRSEQALRAAGFVVHTVPSPGLVRDKEGTIAPASHMNFVIANQVVVVPTYNTKSADEAIGRLADLFPGRRVVGAPSMALLSGGGSFHCISQQEPVRSAL